jgi:S1-C subfamily serine protease
MERHVRLLSERILPATVGVQVDAAQGSGVVVSPQGYVLTAAHVIGKPGRRATVYFPDGRRVLATTLGTYRTMDAGLLKLTPPTGSATPDWPYIEMGDSAKVALGQWCLAAGHPGGIQSGRQPSVRLGRVLSVNPSSALSTDCTLIGGDSGGPLFSMDGKVLAIHSRIGGQLTANLHVPINAYRESWNRLVRSDSWGHTPGVQPYLGVQGDTARPDALLTRVFPKSPADEGGLLSNDVVVLFGGKEVGDFASLQGYVEEQEPGERVVVEVLRGNERVRLEVTIGRRRD